MSGQELFSHRVKAEIAAGITGKKKCLSCLAGMLLYSRELGPGGIVFQTENKTVRDLFVKLCTHEAGENSCSVSKRELKSRPDLWTVKIRRPEDIGAICRSAGVDPSSRRLIVPLSDRLSGQLAAGAFLCCGSVVEPQKEYHLEFVAPSSKLCESLFSLFSEQIGAEGGTVLRRGAQVLYFKESEQVEDVLTFIGAPKASLELMNVKIYKDLRNHANRATNCDTANCQRQNRSALRQIDAINRIIERDGGLHNLPDELKNLAELRLKSPELSLNELAAMADPPLTRSGINHRFARIELIADKKQ